MALQRWVEPRFTADTDISVLVEPGEEVRVAKALLAELPARIDDALDFAERTRVVLAWSGGNVGIDIVELGLMSRVAQGRFRYFTKGEVRALHTFLQEFDGS